MLKRFVSGSSDSSRGRRGPSLPWRGQFNSSGRGSNGNIHTSPAPTGRAHASNVKTKDRNPSSSTHKVMSFGRGGAGNIRARHVVDTGSKSSPLPDITKLENDYLLAHKAWRTHQPQSTGRGGAGNITTLPRPIDQVLQILVTVTKGSSGRKERRASQLVIRDDRFVGVSYIDVGPRRTLI